MTHLAADLEHRLVEGYQQQLRLYDQALATLAAPKAKGDDWARTLHSMIDAITQLDSAMADDKARWRQTGARAGAALSGLLDQVAQRIATLGETIKRQVAQLEERRNQLMPQVDEFIQRRRMLQAYGQYGGRHRHGAQSP